MGTNTSAEKIDVHSAKKKYKGALEQLRQDGSICQENKTYLLTFLNDCSLGKTLPKRQKKKIREKRLIKYIYILKRANVFLGNKDFKKVAQNEMEQFISRLEENQLTLIQNGLTQPVTYSEWTQRDFKMCLRKFYKWLLGEGKYYPELVDWIDTSISISAPRSLSLDEVRKCVDYTPLVKGKALVWTLFETGARAEEFLNIRLKHVEEKQSHFVVGIDYPKTFKRSPPVHEGSTYLREWLKVHPKRNEPNAQLFPITYQALLKFLHRRGKRALGKTINPQLMRDSFATWLASKKGRSVPNVQADGLGHEF